MNKVILIGNLTKDPELKQTTNGINVCNFTIAAQRKYKNASGEYDADFVNMVAWRNNAEFIQKYFSKGNKIGIVGNLQSRSYDAKDGTKRYITEVVVEEVEFVEKKAYSSENNQENNKDVKKLEPIEKDDFVEDDDLPF